MNTKQKKFLAIVYTAFFAFIAYLFAQMGFFAEISVGQFLIFGLFCALCAIPIYYWVRKNPNVVDKYIT